MQKPAPLNLIIRILRSPSIQMIMITVAGMFIGIVVDRLIGAKFGASMTTDALIVAITLPLFVDTIIREGTSFSMVPMMMAKKTQCDFEEFQDFVSGLINFTAIIGLGVLLLIEIFASQVVYCLAPGMAAEGRLQATFLLRLCAPAAFFAFVENVPAVLLNSMSRFNLVAMRNAVTKGIVLLVILAVWSRENIVWIISLAHALGFLFFLLLVMFGAKQSGFRHNWTAWVQTKDIRAVVDSVSLPTLGSLLSQIVRVVERSISSTIAVGGVTAYYFAFRIYSAISTIIGKSIATTSLPTLSGSSIKGEKRVLEKQIQKNIFRGICFSAPIAVGIFFLYEPVITVVFKQGKFDAESIRITGQILRWMCGGIVFFSILPLLNAGLYAQREYTLVFIIRIVNSALGIFNAWLLSRYYGLIGLSMAVSISSFFGVAFATYMLRRTGINIFRLNAGDKK